MTVLGQWLFQTQAEDIRRAMVESNGFTAKVTAIDELANTCWVIDPVSNSPITTPIPVVGAMPDVHARVFILPYGTNLWLAFSMAPLVHAMDKHYYTSSVVDGMFSEAIASAQPRLITPAWRTGVRYSTQSHGVGARTAMAAANVTAGLFRMSPITVPDFHTLASIGVVVTTGAVGANLWQGLFSLNPDTLEAVTVADFGTISVAAAGDAIDVLSYGVYPGQYWLGCMTDITVGLQHTSPALPIYMSAGNTPVGAIGTTLPWAAFPASFTVNTAFPSSVYQFVTRS